MSDVTQRFAIIFVAIPGSGKTSIANKIVSMNPDLNLVCIELDHFYNGVSSDNETYLTIVEDTIKKHNVVLCKNHHTTSSLKEVTDIMKRNHVRYLICNLVPDNIVIMSKEEVDAYMNILLDRIEERTDGSSNLVINETTYKSRARARNVIKHGFLKYYEEPDEPFIRIDYVLPVLTNATLITEYLQRHFLV